MAIYYSPYPNVAQPITTAPYSTATSDIYVTGASAIKKLQKSIGLTWGSYTPSAADNGLTTPYIPGASAPPAAPTIPTVSATAVSPTITVTQNQSFSAAPITVYGGSAVATSYTTLGTFIGYTTTIDKALPAGVTWTSTFATVKIQSSLDNKYYLYNGATVTVSGTPTGPIPATNYTISFTDASGSTANATFSLTVNSNQTPLTASSVITGNKILTQGVTAGVGGFATVTASGGSSPLKYSISPAVPTGLSFNTSTGYISGTPSVALNNTTFTVTVTDGSTSPQTASATFSMAVLANIPTATLAVPTTVLTQGISFTAFAPVTGTGGTAPLTYSITPSLPTGLTFSTSTGVIAGTPSASSAASNYTVTVTDSLQQSASQQFSLTVNAIQILTAIQTRPSYSLYKAVAVSSFTPITANGGYGTISYSLNPPLPTGLTFSTSAGSISGTPTNTATTASYIVSLADQAGQTATGTFALGVLSIPISVTPQTPSTLLTKNATFNSFAPVTASGGYPPYTYNVSPSLPSGLSYGSGTGIITGTATATSPATSYLVTITDSTAQSGTSSFSLTVLQPSALVLTKVISTTTLVQGTATTPFTPISASGGYGSLTYNISPSLTAGLNINAGTGQISGTPSTYSINTTTYSVTVSDQAAQSSTSTFNMNVLTQAFSAVSSVPSTNLVTGVAVTAFTPVTAAGGATPYSYVLNTPLSSGLSFNTSTGRVSGTPTVANTSNYVVTINDSVGQSGTGSFALSISPATPLLLTTVVTNTTLIKSVDLANFTPVIASGGYGTISLTVSPSLPSGLNFSNIGKITGTPTQSSPQTSYLAQGVDSIGQISSATFYVTVNNSALTSTVVVSISTLSQYVAFTPFTPVTYVGGTPPVTYSVSPSLSSGISLNPSTGVLSGTPQTTLSTTPYDITITDNIGGKTTGTIRLNVIAVPDLVSTRAVSIVTAFANQSLTAVTPVTVTGGYGSYSYSVTPGLPSGLLFSSVNGQITGTPSQLLSTATYTVTVTDPVSQTTSTNFDLTVKAQPVVATSSVPASTLIVYQLATPFTPVTGSGGFGTLAYTINLSLPSGLSLNAGTGQITGTPTALSSTASYVITVTDSIAQSSTASFSLSVSEVAPNPLIVTVSAPTVSLTQNQSANASPVQVLGGVSPYTYSLTPSLPAGLTFSTSAGTITGTPSAVTSATTYNITVVDGQPQSVTKSFSLVVAGGNVTGSGNVNQINNTAQSNSTTTGALIVAGGAGIAGNLYAGAVYDNNNRVVTNVNPVGSAYIGISNLVSTGTNVSFAVTNLGVLTLTAGTDTAVSSNTGTVTIWATSTLQTVTDRGHTTTNAINITSAVGSTGTTTGALTVAGGVGIGGNFYVGKKVVATDMSVVNTITGYITTSNNISGGELGSIPYQTNNGNTAFIAIGSADSVLYSDGTTATWQSAAGLASASSTTSTNSNNIFVNPVTPYHQYYIGLTEYIDDYSPVDGDARLIYDTSDSSLSVTKLIVTSTLSNTSSFSSNALYVAGGIGGNSGFNINGDGYLKGNLYVSGIITGTNLTLNVLTANSGTFYGDSTGAGALYAGALGYTPFPQTMFQATGNKNAYMEVNVQNVNAGNQASTDIVASADDVTASNGFIDMGITGSGWDGTQLDSFGNNLGPNDGYLLVGANSTPGLGDLAIGTLGVGTQVRIVVAGTGTDSLTAVFNTATTESVSTGSGAFVVYGGVGIGKNLFVGGDVTVTGRVNFTGVSTPVTAGSATFTTVVITGTNATISTNTGALQIAGGVGIGGGLVVGGATTVTNNTNALSTATGALQVRGGLGIGQDAYVGGKLIINSTDNVSLSPGAGALQVAGGVYIAKDLTVAGSFNATGSFNVNGYSVSTATFNGGVVSNYTNFTPIIPTNSTDTGAVTIQGGLGVGGGISVGGTVTATNFVGNVYAKNTSTIQVGLATTATYAQSFNTSTLVSLAVSATTSSFATTSGYAQSFNTSTLVSLAVSATTSSFATTATYAQSFNTSTLVSLAVSATTSSFATTSGYAQSFNTGTLVSLAVSATTSSFATTATYAQSFNTSTLVSLAVSATTSSFATTSGYAQSFNTGTLVQLAVSANYLTNTATIQVGLATTATYAQSFNTSTLVQLAVSATTSSFATTSGYAQSFNTSTLISTAVNLAGGVAGQIPYQSAAGTTAFIITGTTGQFLISNGSSAPSWTSTASLQVGFANSATYAQSFNTSTLVSLAVSATTSSFATTSGYALSFNTSTLVTTAANITNGTTGAINYQSGPGATTFLTLSGTQNSIIAAGASAPQYVTQVQATNGTASQIQATGQSLVVTAGGLGVTGNSYFANNLGIGGNAYITGDLYVDGTQFVVNSNTISSGDKALVLSTGSSSAALAINAGLYIGASSSTAYSSFYYDGSANWVTGGSSGGGLKITPTTGVNSTSTGALQVAGGVGIGGGLFVGGVITATSIVTAGSGGSITGASLLSTVVLTATSSLSVLGTAGSTSTTTGALQVAGGVGIGGGLFVGGVITATSIVTAGSGGSITGASLLSTVALTATGTLSVLGTASSTSTTTGAVIITGGVGVGGNIYAGNIYSNGSLVATGVATFNGGNVSNIVYINTTTGTTSTNTGALQVQGGVGIGGGLFVGGVITATSIVTIGSLSIGGSFISTGTGGSITGTSLISSVLMTVTSTASSTSTTTGALIVTGGVGVGGNINFGGNLYQNGVLFTGGGGSSTGTTSTFVISSTASTTSTNTGALQVQGGVGIGGGLFVGGVITATSIVTIGNLNIGGSFISTGTGGSITGTSLMSTILMTVTSTASSTSTTTGALIVTGGVGVGGGLFVGGTATATNYLSNAVISSSSNLGAFTYGTLSYADSNNFAVFQTNVNNYAQLVLQNTQAGTAASSDIIVSNDKGTAGTYYGDLGMNSSAFTGVGSLNLPNAVYLTSHDGDLVLGTNVNNSIRFVLNGSATDVVTLSTVSNSVIINSTATITATTATNSTSTGALIVAGGVGVGGGLFVGGTITATNIVINGNGVITSDTFGNVKIISTTATNSTSTGALIVAGGVGIGGGLYVGGVVTATLFVGAFNGSVTTSSYANTATTIVVSTASNNANYYLTFVSTTSGSLGVVSDAGSKLTYNPGAGILQINSTASTTSTTTGALIVTGGVGVGGNIYAANIYSNGALVATGVAAFNGGNVSNIVYINTTTGTTSTNTGALQVQGGVGIGGGVFVGGTVTATNLTTVGGNGLITGVYQLNATNITVTNLTATNLSFAGGTVTTPLTITSTASSTSTTTGALIVSGGVGVGGSLYASSLYTAGGSGIISGVYQLNSQNISATGTVALSGSVISVVTSTNATASTSTTTGALVIAGGVGVGGAVYASSFVTQGGAGVISGVNQISSQYFISTATTTATSTTTGALQIAGGAGIGGNVYVGGNLDVSGRLTFGNNSTATFGNLILTGATQSNSTNTGAITVSGGAGIGGNAYVGGNLYVNNGSQVIPTTIQEFTANAGQTIFTPSSPYTVGTVQIFANGVALGNGDFTASNGTTFVLNQARVSGDIIRFIAGVSSTGINNIKAFSIAMSIAMSG